MKTPTKYIKELSEKEKEDLKKLMKESETGRVRERAHSLLLSNRGYSIDEIADIYEVDRDTVSNWINQWEESGWEGLEDKPRSGRPPTLNEKERALVKKLIEEEPRSVKRVVAKVAEQQGKEISKGTVKRILKGVGKVWKRVRGSLRAKRDEKEFQAAKEEIEDLQELAEEGVRDLYYFDAAGFCLDPCIAYAWQNQGETIEIEAASRGRVNVLGFMNTDNDLKSFVFNGSIDSHVVVGCFDLFCKTITKKTIVIMDNAPIHTSDEFQECIPEWQKKGLLIKFLPEYSPELNLIEILWRKIKYEWLPFSAYESFKALTTALIDILAGVGSKYRISFA